MFGCAAPAERSATTGARDCNTPAFPYQQGWLGGDSAYSVPLDATRTLWLFGDTFVGEPDAPDRRGSTLIHNSIGLSTCDDEGRFAIVYIWGDDSGPGSFRPNDIEGHYFWLFDGFVFEGGLYLGLLEVSNETPRGPLAFPFRFHGMHLMRAELPSDEESAPGKFVFHPFIETGPAFPGAMVLRDAYLYFFAFVDHDGTAHPRILGRFPLDTLRERRQALTESIETWSQDERWIPGWHPEQARILMDDTATEMSVHFDAASERWIAIYSHPNATGGFPDDPRVDAIWMRSAQQLEGPWSAPRIVHRVAELSEEAPGPIDPNTICYGAKAHPQYASTHGIPITYACNLYTPEQENPWDVLARLLERMDLYRPVSVVVELEAFAD